MPPKIFSKGGFVLVYDQDHDKSRDGNFEPLWHGPYVIKCTPQKGAYELENMKGMFYESFTMGST